jgi:hypothetical protein
VSTVTEVLLLQADCVLENGSFLQYEAYGLRVRWRELSCREHMLMEVHRLGRVKPILTNDVCKLRRDVGLQNRQLSKAVPVCKEQRCIVYNSARV